MDDLQVNKQNDSEDQKQRLEFYRNALKYYQGRALSLEISLQQTRQQIAPIPENEKTYSNLNNTTQELLNDITLIKSLSECNKLIRNSLTCSQILDAGVDADLKRNILHKIEGIIYFSKSIMNLYKKKLSELEIIQKKKEYVVELSKFIKHLESVKEKKQEFDEDSAKMMEKAELQVYKINLIRAIKAILISFTSVHYPDIFQKLEKFRNPSRRNLTVDDFTETWDVELAS